MDAKTKALLDGLRHILEQIESGKRQVVSGSLTAMTGEPMAMSLTGTVFSQKFVLELELVASGPTPPVAQDPSGEAPQGKFQSAVTKAMREAGIKP